MTTHELDARNLLCPMPVIKTQNKIKDLEKGDELIVTCTDPGTLQDIPSWCRVNGHEIIDTDQIEREIIIKIRVGEPSFL